MATTGYDLDMLSKSDPAMLQVGPRMELAKALSAASLDTSPAHPMQALARMAQGAAGQYVGNSATSELGRIYAQQAGGMAEALRRAAPGHPLISALENPATAGIALHQAGPAMIELPKEAESRRRFEIEQGTKQEELRLHRLQMEKPDFGPTAQDEYGRVNYGFREPFKKTVTPYTAASAAEPGTSPSAPVIISSPVDRLKLVPGTRYIAKDDPTQQVRVWGGAAP